MIKNRPRVAIFDFDGTLRQGDALLPFLRFYLGEKKLIKCLVSCWKELLSYPFGNVTRHKLKEAVLTACLKGEKFSELESAGKQFAKTVLLTKLKQESLEKLFLHEKNGDTCILVSANLDIFIRPFGQFLGFHHIFATQLEQEDGKVTGHLLGDNCRGIEKVKRVVELMGPKENYEAFAYGDSEGDRELFAFADHAKRF